MAIVLKSRAFFNGLWLTTWFFFSLSLLYRFSNHNTSISPHSHFLWLTISSSLSWFRLTILYPLFVNIDFLTCPIPTWSSTQNTFPLSLSFISSLLLYLVSSPSSLHFITLSTQIKSQLLLQSLLWFSYIMTHLKSDHHHSQIPSTQPTDLSQPVFPLSDLDLKSWTDRARLGGLATGFASCDQWVYPIARLDAKVLSQSSWSPVFNAHLVIWSHQHRSKPPRVDVHARWTNHSPPTLVQSSNESSLRLFKQALLGVLRGCGGDCLNRECQTRVFNQATQSSKHAQI